MVPDTCRGGVSVAAAQIVASTVGKPVSVLEDRVAQLQEVRIRWLLTTAWLHRLDGDTPASGWVRSVAMS